MKLRDWLRTRHYEVIELGYTIQEYPCETCQQKTTHIWICVALGRTFRACNETCARHSLTK